MEPKKDFNQMKLPDTVYVENILEPYLKDFIFERFRDVVEIQDAVSKDDWKRVKNLGHRILGSSGSYGFVDMGTFGKIIEDIAECKDKETVLHLAGLMEYHLKNVNIVFVAEDDT
ncbi:MAG: hypothetical protein AAGB31_13635 [Bdellovibrio sp.]